MVDSGSLSNNLDGTNDIQNISKNELLKLLGMRPRNNKKNLCLMFMLVIMHWKGLIPIPRLGMTVHVYHCITGEQICQ